jgi:hypothetical protein
MWVDWISLRQGEDMLSAGGGRIFRLPRWRAHAETAYLSAAIELADLRELSFRLLRPPGGSDALVARRGSASGTMPQARLSDVAGADGVDIVKRVGRGIGSATWTIKCALS